MVLKRELARRSWAIDAFVGAVFKRRGGDSLGMGRGFNSATNRLVFSFNFASYLPRFSSRFSPRSGRDLASIVVLVLRRSPADRWEANPRRSRAKISSIAARSLRDRGSIAPRSWSSSTMFQRRPIGLMIASRRKIGRSWRYHVAIAYPSDRGHLR